MATNRRKYSAAFKSKVVLQVLTGEKTASEICRQHKLHTSVLNRWRNEFLAHADRIFADGENERHEQQKIAELERLVGQLTLQLDIAKKASTDWTLDKNGRW